MSGRTGICRRCHRDRKMGGRGLCTTCYAIEYKAGRHEQWPLGEPAAVALPAPLVDGRPDTPAADRCDWCGTPLTRSRLLGDERLCEVYTINGRVVAVCFEACPPGRELVSHAA